MKPSKRLALAAALVLGLAGLALWLKAGRNPPPTTPSPVTAKPSAVVVAMEALASSVGDRSQQVRDLIAMIQTILRSDKPALTQEIMALPRNDPRKTAYDIHLMAENVQRRYSGLFQQLGLDADGIQAMTNLLIGEELLTREAMSYLEATRTEVQVQIDDPESGGTRKITALGTGNTADLSDARQRRADAIAPVETEISALLGPEKYALYENYMNALPSITKVDSVQQALKIRGLAALSESQTTQMLAALLAEQTPMTGLYRSNIITDNVVQAAKTFLAPAQQTILEQMYSRDKQLDDAIVAAVEAKRRENAAAGK